ncbi:hypothetical protein [Microcella sp.]|uniref:hypothetical protein n=1 Tax=Microcella sp. TaxID=1913979 RepID=UPI00256D5CEC|nr:hypothetical protein [Microcella sp.]MBX9470387.1 hypothetical protein [Microcella sp.]
MLADSVSRDPTADWVPVGIVFDGDAIDLDGVNPWEQSWQATGEIALVRHPAYPTQVHDVSVYVMQAAGRSIRFAAGELSNNVWGFYRSRD